MSDALRLRDLIRTVGRRAEGGSVMASPKSVDPRAVAVVALLASALLLVSPQASGFVTGNDLLGWCEGPGEANVQCRFYIIGVADAHAADSVSQAFAKGFCIPNDVRASQLQLVVAKWFKAHAQDLHFGAASLLLAALHDAFPCGVKR